MGDARTDLSNDSQIRTAVSEIAKFSELVAETVSSEIKREDFANCDCEIIAMRGQFRRNKYQVQAWAVEYAKQKNLHLFEMTCDTVEKGLDRWLAAISWEREVQSVAEQADELLGPDPNRPTGVLSLERLHENHVFSADDAGNLRANAEALAGLCRVWSPTNVTPSIGGSNKLEAETQASLVEDRWMTFAEAERLTGINRGIIQRAANDGEIVANGKKSRARRIDRVSFTKWAEKRAKKPVPQEDDATVKRKLREQGLG